MIATEPESLDDLIEEHEPCPEGEAWLRTQPDAATAWDACRNPQWLLWAAEQLGLFDAATARRVACALVRRTPLADGRTVWDLLTDERSRNAVVVAERHAAGEATDAELAAARAAAWNATWDAAGEATDAELAAARAAAWDATWDAAGEATDAELAAARDAAWNAARAAATAAAGAAQCAIIRELLPNPFRAS